MDQRRLTVHSSPASDSLFRGRLQEAVALVLLGPTSWDERRAAAERRLREHYERAEILAGASETDEVVWIAYRDGRPPPD